MDVQWLRWIAFVGVKEEAETAFSKDFGHGMSLYAILASAIRRKGWHR
jgi:hypothetical protein